MDRAPLPDLNLLDRDALLALFHAQQEKLESLIADRDEELRRLEAELESHRQTLSEQADELRSRSERIEHLKLMVDKLRHVLFGARSEKIVVKLEQLELELEEEETAYAELEAAAERLSSAQEPKTRPQRKPLPEHLSREVITHAPTAIAVPVAGAIYASSERMSLNNSSTSPTASRSSATCGRSSPAPVAIASSRHQLRLARSSADLRAQACLPM
jgi:hypothetical protein